MRCASPPPSVGAYDAVRGLCSDVRLRASEQEFGVHRLLLAAASPVFLKMLMGDDQWSEARSSVVEIRETSACAMELLLLQHIYTCEIEVPLLVALELYALADAYKLRTNLGEQLRLWLSTVRLSPLALTAVLPAAHTLCPSACNANLYQQESASAEQLIADLCPAVTTWPEALIAAVVARSTPLAGFKLAVLWAGKQPWGHQEGADAAVEDGRHDDKRQQRDQDHVRPRQQPHTVAGEDEWVLLLDSVAWSAAAYADLRAIAHVARGREGGRQAADAGSVQAALQCARRPRQPPPARVDAGAGAAAGA